MTWLTYWLDPDGTCELGLRRYRLTWDPHADPACSCDGGWHTAFTWRGQQAKTRWDDDPDGRRHLARPLPVPRDDGHWPAVCAGCGYRFRDTDEWQTWEEPAYRDATGARYILRNTWGAPPGVTVAGPGAMWDGWWLPRAWHGADRVALMIRCPPGDWPVDSVTSFGGRWCRTGDVHAAHVTATPSVAIGHPGRPGYYRGTLDGGVLSDNLS